MCQIFEDLAEKSEDTNLFLEEVRKQNIGRKGLFVLHYMDWKTRQT